MDVGTFCSDTSAHSKYSISLFFFFTQEYTFCVLSSSARALKLNTVCSVSANLQRKNGPLPAIFTDESWHIFPRDGPCVTPGSPIYQVAPVSVLLECFA